MNASEGIVPRTIPVLLLGDMVSIAVLWKFEESVGLVVIGVGISVGCKTYVAGHGEIGRWVSNRPIMAEGLLILIGGHWGVMVAMRE